MLKIITVGHKMPKWISLGFLEYQKRLGKPFQLELIELPSKSFCDSWPADKIKGFEAELILDKIPPQEYCIALDVQGSMLSTEALSQKIPIWQSQSLNLHFIIGGREGLADSCLKRADFKWSLSALTFPHQMVKLILAEQLYRAVSLINQHPYHRS